jgi:hypothetical protein
MKLPEVVRRLRHLRLPRPWATTPDAWDTLDASEQRIADLLRRHADRLSPPGESLSRVRSVALTAAAAAPASDPATGRVAAGRAVGSIHPRLLAAAAAIALLAVAGVGFAATQTGPGQPFYQWRLNIEAFALPPSGSTARVDADLDRAQERLDEIASAAARQDWNAAADAAVAYTSVVAAIGQPQDPEALATYRQVLTGQLERLQSIRAEAAGPAATALDTAIARVEALLADAGAAPSDNANGDCGNGNAYGNADGTCANKSPGPSGNANGDCGNGNAYGNADGTCANKSAGPTASPAATASPCNNGNGQGNGNGRCKDDGSSPAASPSPAATPTPKHTPKPKAS